MIPILLAGLIWLAMPVLAKAHGGATGPVPTDPLGVALAWHLDVPIMLGLIIVGATNAMAEEGETKRVDARLDRARRLAGKESS